MKVRIISVFRDKDTHEVYEVGAEREFTENRAQHLISLGFVEAIAKEKPAKAEPKVEPVEPVVETAEVEETDAAPAEVAEPVEPAKEKISRRQHRKSSKQ